MKIYLDVVESKFAEIFGYSLSSAFDRQQVLLFAEAIEKEALQLQSDEQQDFGTGPAILRKGSTTGVIPPNEIPWQIQVRLRCAEAVAPTARHDPSVIEHAARYLCEWVMGGDQVDIGITTSGESSLSDLLDIADGVSIHDTDGPATPEAPERVE